MFFLPNQFHEFMLTFQNKPYNKMAAASEVTLKKKRLSDEEKSILIKFYNCIKKIKSFGLQISILETKKKKLLQKKIWNSLIDLSCSF